MVEGAFIDMLGLKTCLCNFSVVPTDSQSLCPYPKTKIAIEQKYIPFYWLICSVL